MTNDCKRDDMPDITYDEICNFARFFNSHERKKFARDNRILFDRLLSFGFRVSFGGVDYSKEELEKYVY